VDLACTILLTDPVTASVATIDGEIFIDVETPDQSNAISFVLSNFSLARVVNVFWQTVPGWLETGLESFDIGLMDFSFNPSPFAITFPNPLIEGTAPIPAGLVIKASNVNLFKFICLDYLGLIVAESGISAGLQLNPMSPYLH
jgi:hypothetical protein